MSTLRLDGKVAVVTGASRGLGRHMAGALAQTGATVVALARSREGLEAVTAEIAAAGGRAHPVACDVTDEAAVVDVMAAVVDEHGSLDVLVNNAGVGPETPALEVALDEWRSTFELNVYAAFAATREAAHHMRGSGGTILNVASIGGLTATPGLVTYSVSKAALIHMTRVLAVELAPIGVTVNCIAPGYVPTDINAAAFADPHVRERVERRIPLRRLGDLEDIGAAVTYLCSPAARYLTGVVLPVDGGIAAR